MNKPATLYIVIPCYNEQDVLFTTADRLEKKLRNLISADQISENSKILFVDDGSYDDTWEIINELNKRNSIFCGISLSRNKGHQNALLAGLNAAAKYSPDAIISMDADLQDDIEAVDRMLNAYYDGFEVVYGVRSSRRSDHFFKRFTAESFYKIMDKLGVETVFNHADYRLLSLRALRSLLEYGEKNLFLRGIIPQIGYKSATVKYERSERFAGESKYPLKKMISFAWDGITGFSIKPLNLILTTGIIIFVLGILSLITLAVLSCCSVNFKDLLWILSALITICGIQLLAVGIAGQYIGKTYTEVKNRPRYFIDKEIF